MKISTFSTFKEERKLFAEIQYLPYYSKLRAAVISKKARVKRRLTPFVSRALK
jgi:hypothetical protein